MLLLRHFDIPSGFQLGKLPHEFPFQGPVFFALIYKAMREMLFKLTRKFPLCRDILSVADKTPEASLEMSLRGVNQIFDQKTD